jgi:hypothetical protein
MANPEDAELVRYIRDLIEVTAQGEASWNKVNPTTFVWDIPNRPQPARLVLQQLGTSGLSPRGALAIALEGQSKYVFQAFNLTTPQNPVLVINGSDNDGLNGNLRDLFNAISGKESRKGIDFLGAVIADAKRKF